MYNEVHDGIENCSRLRIEVKPTTLTLDLDFHSPEKYVHDPYTSKRLRSHVILSLIHI